MKSAFDFISYEEFSIKDTSKNHSASDEQNCNSIELDVKYDDYDAVDFFAITGFRPQALNLIMDLK